MSETMRNEGWTEFHGGECPVTPNTEVSVRLRDGTISVAKARVFKWVHEPGGLSPHDIVGFRVSDPLKCDDRNLQLKEGPGIPPMTSIATWIDWSDESGVPADLRPDARVLIRLRDGRSLGPIKVSNLFWYKTDADSPDDIMEYFVTVDLEPPLIIAAKQPGTGIDATLAERGTRYGDFRGHALITQDLKNVMVAAPKWEDLSPSQKEALEMIAHKIGRILNGDPNYHDSWHDIVGYAKLVADTLEH